MDREANQDDNMDPKGAKGDGGDAKNGNAKGNSKQTEQSMEQMTGQNQNQQQQQQQPHRMFPYSGLPMAAMMMPPGGMMGGGMHPGMQGLMEDIMAMGGYGPPPNFDPSGLSTPAAPWMMSVNGSNNYNNGNVKEMAPGDLPRKPRQNKMKISVNIPGDKEIGDDIRFENPMVPGQKLKVKVPKNADMEKRCFTVSIPDDVLSQVGKKGKKSKKDEQQQQAASLVKRRAKRSRLNNETATTTGNNDDESAEPEVHIELMSDSWKKTVLEKFPRCKSAEGIRDTSYFVTMTKGQCTVSSSARRAAASRASANLMGHPPAVGGMSNIQCLRKLLSELNRMEYEDTEQLPGGTAPIWLRYDDECPQYMRAIITGPPRDTPYSNGLFTFDIYVPDSYPQISPTVQLLTTGGGTVRFGPNLYADGKVCLSLLGTWSGPKWNPQQSSISQILVSIQGLVLGVEHPK